MREQRRHDIDMLGKRVDPGTAACISGRTRIANDQRYMIGLVEIAALNAFVN